MRTFKLSPQALNRLTEIAEYTEKVWGIRQRDTYLDAMDAAFYALAQSPNKGRKHNDVVGGLLSYKDGKHLIFYFNRDDYIQIIDILHESMDVGARMGRWTRGH
jgi:toxin ParE1/3/4